MQLRFPCAIGFLIAIGGVAEACSPDIRVPGNPVVAPFAAFDARVIEVREEKVTEDGKEWLVQIGSLQITRSLQGPHRVGDIVPTRTVLRHSCADSIEVGWEIHVQIWPGRRAPYFLGGAGETAYSMLSELANVVAEPRQSTREAMAGVTLRGQISDRAAMKLLERAKPEQISGCEVRRAESLAQVSCGRAYDGNDAAFKVIFERVNARWKEVTRYKAGATPPGAAAEDSTS